MIIRSAISYFSYSLMGAILSFLSIIYLTRVLTPEQYGYLGLFASLSFFVVPLLGFRCEGLVGINRVKLDKKKYRYFREVYISFSLVIFVAVICAASLITITYFEKFTFLVIATLFIGLNRYLITLHSTELIQDQKSHLFGQLNVLTVFMVLLVSIICLSMFDMSWQGRLVAIYVVEICMVLYRLYFASDIFKTYNFNLSKKEIKKITVYGFPLFFALGLSWCIFEADKLLVLSFFSMEDLGLYAVAYSVGAFLNQINQSVTNAVTPKIYNKLNINKGFMLIKKYNIYYSIFIIFIATVSSIFFYFYSGFILGEAYEKSGLLIGIIIMAYAFFGIYSTSGIVINFYKLNKLKTKILFVGALSNLALSLLLIPYIGLVAPAYGTLLSFMILAVLSYVFSRKELNKRKVLD